MKFQHLFFTVLLSLSPITSYAQEAPCAENHDFLVASYLQDLEEQGYCIIPQLFSTEETEQLYQRVWHEFIEKAWPSCQMEDRSNWKESFPIHSDVCVFAGPAGQTQVMWDLRQDPRIVDVFAQLWNTNELIVSMDGLSFICPPEIREGHVNPWPHVDQAVIRRKGSSHSNTPPAGFVSESPLKTEPFTIQGQFLFEDSFDGDGGFYCLPKSHLKFAEFAPVLEEINVIEAPKEEKWKKRDEYLESLFGFHTAKHVTAPKGSLILWDSRTIHWNQYPSKNRPYQENPKVRMVGYLCYVPKARLTQEGRKLRREAFEKGISTGHNPAYPELKTTQQHMSDRFSRYLEDPSYVQPEIQLTSLGKSLLGFSEEPALFYWDARPRIGSSNFGDALSVSIVEKILGRAVSTVTTVTPGQKKFLAIGSIASYAEEGDTLWGTGINGRCNKRSDYPFQTLDVRAVRGPLSREVLLEMGIACPEVYGDPTLLIPKLFPELKRKENPSQEFIVIPHFSDEYLFSHLPNLVSVKEEWQTVVERILDSKFVIASALSGVIVAEAFGIPARLLIVPNKKNTENLFKYSDYYYGTGRYDYRFATSIEEALEMGGEPMPQCDLEELLKAFPYDLFQ